MTKFAPIKPGKDQGAQQALDAVWGVVQETGLKVGDQLPSIRQLAERLEMKSSVVRDAILAAGSMGLVKVVPRTGAFLCANAAIPVPTGEEGLVSGALLSVLQENEPNLFHLLDARRLIEIELVGRAAERRSLEDLLPIRTALEALLRHPEDAPRSDYVSHDIRFHVEIARLSGNLVLFAMQRTLMELLRRHLNQGPYRAIADHSHVAIYEALVAGDAKKARLEMGAHLTLAYDTLLKGVQELPNVGATPP